MAAKDKWYFCVMYHDGTKELMHLTSRERDGLWKRKDWYRFKSTGGCGTGTDLAYATRQFNSYVNTPTTLKDLRIHLRNNNPQRNKLSTLEVLNMNWKIIEEHFPNLLKK